MELGQEVTIIIVTHYMQQAARVSQRYAQGQRAADHVNGRFR